MSNIPYAKYVEGLDLVASLAETPRRIETLVRAWDGARFEQSYEPGKWPARKILVHLAQMEMVFATRLRFALAEEDYEVQPFDQDPWMAVEEDGDGRAALDAYLALRAMNLAICRRLTPSQRARTFTHPQFAEINVDWILTQVAGHERHHLPQLEAISVESDSTRSRR